MSGYVRRPEWLKLNPLDPTILGPMRRLTHDLELHTVCESAHCPNRPDCFSRGTAAFMILGDTCTRHCTFCGVKKGGPEDPDPQDPQHIVDAISTLKLRYVVVTSVSRDDPMAGLPTLPGPSEQFMTITGQSQSRSSSPILEVRDLLWRLSYRPGRLCSTIIWRPCLGSTLRSVRRRSIDDHWRS